MESWWDAEEQKGCSRWQGLQRKRFWRWEEQSSTERIQLSPRMDGTRPQLSELARGARCKIQHGLCVACARMQSPPRLPSEQYSGGFEAHQRISAPGLAKGHQQSGGWQNTSSFSNFTARCYWGCSKTLWQEHSVQWNYNIVWLIVASQ